MAAGNVSDDHYLGAGRKPFGFSVERVPMVPQPSFDRVQKERPAGSTRQHVQNFLAGLVTSSEVVHPTVAESAISSAEQQSAFPDATEVATDTALRYGSDLPATEAHITIPGAEPKQSTAELPKVSDS